MTDNTITPEWMLAAGWIEDGPVRFMRRDCDDAVIRPCPGHGWLWEDDRLTPLTGAADVAARLEAAQRGGE